MGDRKPCCCEMAALRSEIDRRSRNDRRPLRARMTGQANVESLSSLPTATLIGRLRDSQRAIYGTDDRRDLYQVAETELRKVAGQDRAVTDWLVEAVHGAVVAAVEDASASPTAASYIADSKLPARAGGTRIRSIGSPHSSAGDHRAAVRAEADQDNASRRRALADELADVDHAVVGHVGVARVADVRVVLPDDGLGVGPVVAHQPVERLGHVPVADVPRLGPAADHRPVIRLGVLHHQRVLLGVEVGLAAVVAELSAALARSSRQQVDHLVLARVGHEGRRPRVLLHVLAVRLEAAEGRLAAGSAERVDPLQVVDDR